MARTAGPSPVDGYLREVYDEFVTVTDGQVADYIPALASADPEPFGICMATVDGAVYACGDVEREFTMQSTSKPFTYALAITDCGLAEVLDHVGVEPSGEAFNEISLDSRGRPRNPMINAGAITSASLVQGDSPFDRILQWYGRWAGRELTVDEEVYQGESQTGHRNRAIAHLLRGSGAVSSDPERALDAYFRQCSVSVTVQDLAVMAGTLAARGRNPITGDQVVTGPVVDQVLSVMTTCGMYDAAGQWLVDVGMPAKSGVAGGVIGVLPGQLAIAVFSPRLDPVGNSVRGVLAFQKIARDLELHFLHAGRPALQTVQHSYSVAEMPSTRRRGATARAALDSTPAETVVMTIGGDLVLAGVVAICRRVVESPARYVVLDLEHCSGLDSAAARLFSTLGDDLAQEGRTLVLVGSAADAVASSTIRTFASLDPAKEWCEDELLRRAGVAEAPVRLELAEHPLAASLSAAGREELANVTQRQRFSAGDHLVHRGDDAATIFLLLEGEVQVVVSGSGAPHRLTTLPAGSTFGESALAGGTRSADIIAITDGEVAELRTGDLHTASPELRAAVLAYLLQISHQALDRATRRIDALSRQP